jgi:hypothetical protein
MYFVFVRFGIFGYFLFFFLFLFIFYYFFIFFFIFYFYFFFLGNARLQKSVGNISHEITDLVTQAIRNLTFISNQVDQIPEIYRENIDTTFYFLF